MPSYDSVCRNSATLFDLVRKQQRIEQLEDESATPAFWSDPVAAQKVMRELSQLRQQSSGFERLRSEVEEIEGLLEIAEIDPTLEDQVQAEFDRLSEQLAEQELAVMLSGQDDAKDAILIINAGQGGTEAQDWAEMLERMFSRWAEKQKYKVTLLDEQPGEGAGIKSATMEIKGLNAFGYLKAENGVHRLVRISPYDSNARRHTSFASVYAFPILEEESNVVEVNPAFLQRDTYRSGGKGGQNVNKVETAVRLTYKYIDSTGEAHTVIAACQEERSQFQNSERAMKMLKSRIAHIEKEVEEARLAAIEGTKKRITWGSQIRSYVFQPYTMVKDHRTKHHTSDVQAVMDGDLTEFMKTFLLYKGGKLKINDDGDEDDV